MSKAQQYEYIRKAYNVFPVVGERVRHTVTGKSGTIARMQPSQAHYVSVKFDGRNNARPCHPTELEYGATS